jgi:hypothetical protein
MSGVDSIHKRTRPECTSSSYANASVGADLSCPSPIYRPAGWEEANIRRHAPLSLTVLGWSRTWHPQGPPTSTQPPRATTSRGAAPPPDDSTVDTRVGEGAMRDVGTLPGGQVSRFIVGPRGEVGGGWATCSINRHSTVGARRGVRPNKG